MISVIYGTYPYWNNILYSIKIIYKYVLEKTNFGLEQNRKLEHLPEISRLNLKISNDKSYFLSVGEHSAGELANRVSLIPPNSN